MNADEFLAAMNVDFADEAVITDDPVFPPASVDGNARVQLVHYEPAEQSIRTEASGSMFLASSEKLTPELRITIDGGRVRPIQINTLFAGVNVPAGRHEIVFTRRIGRGWWPSAILAALAIAIIGLWELNLFRLPSPGASATSAATRPAPESERSESPAP